MKYIQLFEGFIQSLQEAGDSLETTTGEETLSIDLTGTWDPGYHSVAKMKGDGQKKLDEELNKLREWLITNEKKITSRGTTSTGKGFKPFTIQIDVGESKVPSVDREAGGKAVKEGYLSEKRGESIKNYIEKAIGRETDLYKKYLIYPEYKIITHLGTEPYDKSKDKSNDEKYQKDIYVKLTVDITAKYTCLVNGTITVSYDPAVEAKFAKHECDFSLFYLFLNEENLGIVNLNNSYLDVNVTEEGVKKMSGGLDAWFAKQAKLHGFKGSEKELKDAWIKVILDKKKQFELDTANNRKTDGKIGGARSNTFTLTEEILKKAVGDSKELKFSIVPLVVQTNNNFKWFSWSPSDKNELSKSHADTPHVKITLGNSDIFDANIGQAFGMKNISQDKSTVILTTDLCGNPTGPTKVVGDIKPKQAV